MLQINGALLDWHTHFVPSVHFTCGLRVAKFDPKVGSRRTTKIKNLVVLVIILVVLILLPYYMYVELVLILLFLLVRERKSFHTKSFTQKNW